jgi:hypothetical protein
MADEMREYDPTMRERMASALQGGMEGLGVNRYKARKHAQTIMGGDSSNLPLGMGAADFVPFLGTGLQTEEAARDLGKAGEAAKRGDYIDAGVEGVAGLAGMLPGAHSTIKGAKDMLKKIKAIDLPKLKLIETDSVPKGKKQSLKEWAMAGGGVPESHKGREHVWHKKAQKYAAGGEVYNTVPDMADGGDILDGPAYAGGGAVKKVVKDAVEGVVEGIKPMVDRINMHFKDVTKRVPELTEGAQKIQADELTRAQYERLVNKHKPVKPYEFVPKPATRDEAYNALNSDKRDLYGVPSSMLEAGHPVGLRLDIPAYSDHGVWVPAVHQQDAGFGAGDRIGYENVAGVMNPKFGMSEKAALNIAAGKPKGTIATIKGDWNPMDEATAMARAQEYLDHPEWAQVGMDPERHGYFYDRRTMQPITAADEAIQIGPLVLARNPQYGNKKDYKYAEGGEAHMAGGGAIKNLIKGALANVSEGVQKVLPAAEREANKAKFLEQSKTPMVLYHGTTATEGGKGAEAIRRIKPSKEGALGSGVYLTPSSAHASGYSGIPNDEALDMMLRDPRNQDFGLKALNQRNSGNVLPAQMGGNMLPVHAQIKNPLFIEGTHGDPMIEALVKLGMDEDKASRMVERAYEQKGYIGKEVESRARAAGYDGLAQYRNGELSEVVAYNPNAVKSSIGNRGTYDITSPELNEAQGGAIRLAKGGPLGEEVKNVVKKGLKKLFGDAPKGVEPIVVRTPEERAVIDKFGQKQEQEAVRQKKVEKAAKQSASQSPEDQAAKPAKSTGKRVAVPPDVYRKMAENQGDEAVLKAARAGKHLKPTGEGYIGAPRTVTSGQGLGAMRRDMDTDFADSVEAVRLADPERLGTWYDRAKQGIAESVEPYQLPRTLEQHGVYSAGVSPESELTFSLKHLNSRVAGEPGMAYRGAGMRNLDEAVAEGRPANMGFKIGEYAEKNDPRVPNAGLFGVNDFRRAQGMGYTDPQGNPWKAGVSDTMHPFMDAETALQVDRANAAGTGGRTDWQGPHIQEVPWVYGKGQDLYSRGSSEGGRYGGDELEGIKMSLRDANNTARDYFYKHAGSSTHEAIPGANTGHVPQMIDAPYEQKVAYGNTGRWDVPAPEYALSDMGTVGAGNRDAIYSALGYRQLPTIEASGAYFPEGSDIAEHQPVKIARPLLDFPTGGGGIVSEPTRQTMEFAERFRALGDANEAFGFNLPNTMANVKGKNSLVLDTRGANPRYLDEPHTGVMPNEAQMGALTQALGDAGYGVAPTSRGATVFPFDSKATAADARRLMKEKGSALQQIYPSEMEPSLNTSGYGPGVGMYTPDGFKATEPFSGQATMGLLKEASYLPPEVAINLGESEDVRKALKGKIKRDAALPNARADIQETRRFFSEADWPKAVALIRQGYTPAAALAALGYSASSMAEDRR